MGPSVARLKGRKKRKKVWAIIIIGTNILDMAASRNLAGLDRWPFKLRAKGLVKSVSRIPSSFGATGEDISVLCSLHGFS